jgi:hypothetical protein
MTIENGNTPHHQRNQSAGKNDDGLTLPPDAFASPDAFINALADELGPEFRELTDPMSDVAKRQFMIVAILLRNAPEEIARLKKLIEADDRLPKMNNVTRIRA